MAIAKRRGGALALALLIALVVAGAAYAVVALAPGGVRWLTGMTGSAGSVGATESVEPTMTPEDLAAIAAEKVVGDFYDALNHDDPKAARALLTTAALEAVTDKTFADWKYTAFMMTRSMVGTSTAQIFGTETTVALAGKFPGLRFSLVRIGEIWRISKWQGVGFTALKGAAPKPAEAAGPIVLNPTTSHDLVSTLMQARQVGDAVTLKLLTTSRFQFDHAAWFDGSDNSTALTAFEITSVKEKSGVYHVLVSETWHGKKATYDYTVVRSGDEIRVDTTTAP